MRLLALAFLNAAALAAPQNYERLRVLGWSACSVAVQHTRSALPDEQGAPLWGRLGALTIDGNRFKTDWVLDATGGMVWDPNVAEAAARRLRQSGYADSPFEEELLYPAEGVPAAELVLRSSSGFVVAGVWPAAERLLKIYYSSTAACALALFQNGAALDFKLGRVRAGIRQERAKAHMKNARYYHDVLDDLDAAAREAAASVRTYPDSAESRYFYAEMLSAQGRAEETLEELGAAVRLDPTYAEKARTSPAFEELRKEKNFEKALNPWREEHF